MYKAEAAPRLKGVRAAQILAPTMFALGEEKPCIGLWEINLFTSQLYQQEPSWNVIWVT